MTKIPFSNISNTPNKKKSEVFLSEPEKYRNTGIEYIVSGFSGGIRRPRVFKSGLRFVTSEAGAYASSIEEENTYTYWAGTVVVVVPVRCSGSCQTFRSQVLISLLLVNLFTT